MKIKFWITIFVLSFSLVAVAVAEVPRPIFRIPDLELPLYLDLLKEPCLPLLESKQSNISAVRKFELNNLGPIRTASCHKTDFLRPLPIDFGTKDIQKKLHARLDEVRSKNKF